MNGLTILSFAIIAQLSPTPTTRVVAQSASSGWSITYAFPLPPTADAPLIIVSADLSARIASPGLSNSRSVASGLSATHGVPRPASHTLEGYGAASTALLNGLPDAAEKCQERATITLWSDSPEYTASMGRRDPEIGPPMPRVEPATPPGDSSAPGPVTVLPGGTLNVRLTLAHLHDGTDGLDVLLGRRDITIKVGNGPTAWTYRDTADLSREQYLNLPDRDWLPMASIPEDHRDTLIFFSAPDCLILDASETGHQYFRFPERKVRGGVRMRLRFRYMITPWCDGEARVRLAQYRETPNAWKVLADAGFERELRKPSPRPAGKRGAVKAGTWLVFDEVFATHFEATTMAIDFRIANAESGLAWIDDVSVDYVGAGGPRVDSTNNP